MSTHPTTDWTPLHNRFYRRLDIYTLLWKDIDLSRHLVAAAPFGGPIGTLAQINMPLTLDPEALIRNDSKSFALQASLGAKQSLVIYTASGKLANQIQWDKGRIIAMAWTNSERLVCVVDAGMVRVLDYWGDSSAFSLGQDAKDFSVVECRFWGNGLVALTGNFKMILVDDYSDAKPKFLAESGLSTKPRAWTVIPPHLSQTKRPQVLAAVKSTLITIDEDAVIDLRIAGGPFTALALSPNGKFLALFNASGKVVVLSSDFQKQLADFNTESTKPPIQMAWCGNDSVTLHWEDLVLVVGPFGDCIRYTYDGTVVLVSEIDGVRILTNAHSQFLQKVPASTESIFKIGSTAPGAILYDAFDHFGRKSPKADENIRSIKNELTAAVDECLEAAAQEYSAPRQKSLLRAASFGKCFIEDYKTEKFTTACETIRVLNALRRFEIGIPLSFSQYCHLTPEVVIGRLAQRHYHALALSICEYLKISPSRVMVHWACSKIKTSSGSQTDAVLEEITEKLSSLKTPISYVQIAKTAYQLGHTKLAAKLMEYEPIAANQVSMLMSMDQDSLALDKAVDSGDTELMYAVILHIKRKHPMAEFFRLLKGKDVALNLVQVYAKEVGDTQLLKDYYYQDDRKSDMAKLLLQEGLAMTNHQSKINKLKEAQRLFQESKDHAYDAKMVEDQIKLLQLHAMLERETGESFANLTVIQTIYKLLLSNHINFATKVKTDLKVSDRKYLFQKMKAIIELRDWAKLEQFVKTSTKVVPVDWVLEELRKKNESEQIRIYEGVAASRQQQNAQSTLPFISLFRTQNPAASPTPGSSGQTQNQ